MSPSAVSNYLISLLGFTALLAPCRCVSFSYLSWEALSVEEVLGTLGVLAPKVEADLLQPVAVTQRAPRDVHQVSLVRPQGHVLPRVVHGASHLQRNRQAGMGMSDTLIFVSFLPSGVPSWTS